MVTSADVKTSLLASFAAAERDETPYVHFTLRDVVPTELVPQLVDLPFPAPALGGVSGTREAHNKSRNYFDVEHRQKHAACDAFTEAFQDPEVVSAVEKTFGTDLEGTYLRVEFAQDTDGFWLEPHTDIGVKAFTMLLYLSD
ncbi:MAG: 2OG-Fe(II) oxygenase, partial [Pseudomonadota bacterium]